MQKEIKCMQYFNWFCLIRHDVCLVLFWLLAGSHVLLDVVWVYGLITQVGFK